MELVKQLEFLDPSTSSESIHIIGCGAIGSTVAVMLTRMGFTDIHLYDFDTVEDKNVCNQTFFTCHIDDNKTNAVAKTMWAINGDCKITKHTAGWKPETNLDGYVFLCVDSIELRKQIVEENQYNTLVKAFIDFRMGLTDAQSYAALRDNEKDMKCLLAGMQFTDAEAKAAMPVSACGSSLSVRFTVVGIVCAGIANFVHILKKTGQQKRVVLLDYATFQTTTM